MLRTQAGESLECSVARAVAQAARWTRTIDQISDSLVAGTQHFGDYYALFALLERQREARRGLRREYGLRLRALRNGQIAWWVPSRYGARGACACGACGWVPTTQIAYWSMLVRTFRWVWNAHVRNGAPPSNPTPQLLDRLRLLPDLWPLELYDIAAGRSCGGPDPSGAYGLAGWAVSRLSLSRNRRLRAALPTGRTELGDPIWYSLVPSACMLALEAWHNRPKCTPAALRNLIAQNLASDAPARSLVITSRSAAAADLALEEFAAREDFARAVSAAGLTEREAHVMQALADDPELPSSVVGVRLGMRPGTVRVLKARACAKIAPHYRGVAAH